MSINCVEMLLSGSKRRSILLIHKLQIFMNRGFNVIIQIGSTEAILLPCVNLSDGINNVAGWPSTMFTVAVDSHDNWMVRLCEKVSILIFPKCSLLPNKSIMCSKAVFIKAGTVQLHVMDSFFVPLLPFSGTS